MGKAKIGRPRSEESQEAIIRATHELLTGEGAGSLTIEAIARRAAVGKPTIYRWWPSLADIVLEVLLRQAEARIAVTANASLGDTLRDFLRQSMRVIEKGGGVHLRFLMACAQTDEGFRERLRRNLTEKRRAVLRSIFKEAMARGEIRAEQNPDLVVDMIFGAMWYRLLTGHAPMDERFADELADAALRVVRAAPYTER